MGIIHKRQVKISFCITCMNRLHHIKKTLETNIKDNFLPGMVEFVLLDYSSSDGLETWIRNEMISYIKDDVLVFYRTPDYKTYKRSHSRNLAFNLASGKIVCNLDADIYLGKDFAKKMISEFQKNSNTFYTNDQMIGDLFGKVIVLKKDFLKIHGYNEFLNGYGFEDIDLYTRLISNGLKQVVFYEKEFCKFIEHSVEERIINEYYFQELEMMFISYINPYTTKLFILLKNKTCKMGVFIDNLHLNSCSIHNNKSINDYFYNDLHRIVLEEDLEHGIWFRSNNVLSVSFAIEELKFTLEEDNTTLINEKLFYLVSDPTIITQAILLLSDCENYRKVKKSSMLGSKINTEGFGSGRVYRNFDTSSIII
ncbi:glycosyltransferase [Sphingobacterium sp. GVS05A]|uniref:glycosyltransferase n=1 Tax=Sphingobacterium TaxID=28453 RepID=UPI001CBB1178|nr:glycosyltransferase family A protein [Sphingobacterium sp. GVS05A]